ncbi:unnamed protein product [Didymodactylos carnosus]|uniref:Uncharacterized protein n=1 Tax=Didymodactylos carnosus TaxID=1234261 RepID=A0A813Y9E6_9BILA|nr:unnamed protein product [Didymodactylos carnosus]CAF1033969.1 unnamed protein product [Didymodactylos carnosus]CAF3667167.1 unnamed protein product [Didymodactylos carnosus]CAF3802247.1 unnamed protein product [Didymodactylos carnosus]
MISIIMSIVQYLIIAIFLPKTVISLVLSSQTHSGIADLYPAYSLSYDIVKVKEWSNSSAFNYITTVHIADYDHHIFQYRPYPCQFYYTDEIQINPNETTDCVYNTTTLDYEYSLIVHLDSRHIETPIIRNIAIKCPFINCSLSLLSIKYIHIDWNNQIKLDHKTQCSFDNTTQWYKIIEQPYTVSEPILMKCKTSDSCKQSKTMLEDINNFELKYSSPLVLDQPYCSIEQSLNTVIASNFNETLRLINKIIRIMEKGFGKVDETEQEKLAKYVRNKLTHYNDEIINQPQTTTPHEIDTSKSTHETLYFLPYPVKPPYPVEPPLN